MFSKRFLFCFVRTVASDIDERHQKELEEQDRELAERVATATLDQVKVKIAADMAILKERVPTAEKTRAEAAEDLKYLVGRQQSPGMQSNFVMMLNKNRENVIFNPGFFHIFSKALSDQEGAEVHQRLDAGELQDRFCG